MEIDSHVTDFYHPQHSCGKVMFLHLSVSHSVHRGVSGRYPLHCADTPLADIPQADTPLGRYPPLLSACWDTDTPCPVHAQITPPYLAATAADGTHPTGMHSCFFFFLKKTLDEFNIFQMINKRNEATACC